ncbi:MAG: type III PLP-dependent enzyme [Patescibacteria group bacterium]|nr:type III PLP-dependent enzyme [Patescibacteria group bacterium]MDD5715928.1 type III PLP-dependent enzyme [Patescibacteria group bacterium]
MANDNGSGNGLERYMTREEFEKIKQFGKGKETPFLVVSLSKVAQKYDELKKNFPYGKIYFAIKACPIDEVISLLHARGSCFDVASPNEIDKVLRLGVPPEKISFGNTIKKERDIAYAYQKGVRLFATDAPSDVEKLARQAPGSKVFMRIMCEGGNADWPLSKKFGAHPDLIYKIAQRVQEAGLIPYGVSFHVGSQQRDIGQWDNAIAQTKYLFESLRKDKGITLRMINLGGGLPASYIQPTQPLTTYAKEITRFLREDFGDNMPEILIEPGRSIMAEAGVIVTEIVMVSKKSTSANISWVYFDAGKFNGLIETMNESIKYPIFVDGPKSKETKEVILAGPSCDSMDTLYETYKYKLPKDIKEGDRAYVLSTGAYTASYCSVFFNGFSPMKFYVMD